MPIFSSSALSKTPTAGSAPFIGCAGNGMSGPVRAPSAVGAIPSIPASAGNRLAYYSSENLAVLAPRGWHCFMLYGSDGSVLVVAPELKDAASSAGLRGPAVVLSRISGGTSGRFIVAKIAARLFPAAKPFVQSVIDEEIEPAEDFPFSPYPNDKIVRRDDTMVEFITPANCDGAGTAIRFVKNDEPISGVAILLPNQDMDLVDLAIRLPDGFDDLLPSIVTAVERTHGRPELVQ